MTIKQVIVMRTDLGMRKGKMIAQGAHASIAFLARGLQYGDENNNIVWCEIPLTRNEWNWVRGIYTKICVRVDSEEELLAVHKAAEDAGLGSYLITDNGLTEFNGVPTNTCCAIGPDLSEKIDPITKHLRLL